MMRNKIYAPPAPTRAGFVVQRAIASPALRPAAPARPAAPKTLPAVGKSEVNTSAEPVAAVVVPHGHPTSSGRLELVGPGSSFGPSPGSDLRGFIHRDGTAIRFAGAAGAVHLDAGETRAEFGPLVSQAQSLLHARMPALQAPKAAVKPVHREMATAAAPGADAAQAVQHAVAHSSGRPLPESSRSRLESSFGADLSAVRVHTDTAADTAAQAVHAHAFTTGQDVFFRAGKYQPDTADGQKLIAHETAHTVQQGAAGTAPARQADTGGLSISEPGDRSEREAVAAAESAAAGKPAELQPIPNRAATPVARLASAASPVMGIAASPTQTAPAASPPTRTQATGSPPAGNPGGNPNGSGPVAPTHGLAGIQLWSPHSSDRYESEANRAATAVARGEPFAVAERTGSLRLQPMFDIDLGTIQKARDFIAPKANAIPGFRLLALAQGQNPVDGSKVDRTPANLARAVIESSPGGIVITKALDSYGIIDQVGSWVSKEIEPLLHAIGSIADAVIAFAKTLGLDDFLHPDDAWERAKRIFTQPIANLINFGKGLIVGIVAFIKEAILMPVAKLAEGTRGWDLLIAVLGKNPITGAEVPRTVETLIPGFLKLIGEEEIWNKIKEAKAFDRISVWFRGALKTLIGFVNQLPTLAMAIFDSLKLEDVLDLPRAFSKVAGVFGTFLGDFTSWAGTAVWTLLEIVFDVVSPGALAYIKKTGSAFQSILKNPLPFVGNLVKAAKLGFENFGANIGTHLKAGLIDWLLGALPGVYIPKAFSLAEIGKFVISVLGISWEQIRAKLVKALGPNGETIMKGLETTYKVVMALITGGPIAIWEIIKEKLGDIKDAVIGGITDFIIGMVVQKAIPKLIALFVPGAGFISAIVSIYDTIMVFVEKISKIIQVVTAFLDSIVAIAGGAIGAAAGKVESILAGLLSLAINFLAGFLGLTNVADKILAVIEKIRAAVDKALDAAIAWIVEQAKKLFGKLTGKGKKDERTDEQKQKDLDQAIADAEVLQSKPKITEQKLKSGLQTIKIKYKLTSLDLVEEKQEGATVIIHVEGVINPKKKGKSGKVEKGGVSRGTIQIQGGDIRKQNKGAKEDASAKEHGGFGYMLSFSWSRTTPENPISADEGRKQLEIMWDALFGDQQARRSKAYPSALGWIAAALQDSPPGRKAGQRVSYQNPLQDRQDYPDARIDVVVAAGVAFDRNN